MSSPHAAGSATLDDPFRLGWRYVREVDAEGRESVRQVPLTERDLLFPQEGDFVVQRDVHLRDMLYLREALRTVLRDRPEVRVLADHRIDFNLPGVEPLGPDVAVLEGLPHWDRQRGTVYLSEGGCPLLVIEVTSHDTRTNDLGIKRDYYRVAEVPFYVVVDHQPGGVELIVWRLRDGNYSRVGSDAQGRFQLPQLGLSLGLENNEVWVHRRGGDRIEETPDLQAALDQARQELEASAEREERFEAQMEVEIDLRQQAQREAAQEREARRLAEEARRLAEERTAAEREARRQAEERAAELERRLRELEDFRPSPP